MPEPGSPETTETLKPMRFDQLCQNARTAWKVFFGKTPDVRERLPDEMTVNSPVMFQFITAVASRPDREHAQSVLFNNRGEILVRQVVSDYKYSVIQPSEPGCAFVAKTHSHAQPHQINSFDMFEMTKINFGRIAPEDFDTFQLGFSGVIYPTGIDNLSWFDFYLFPAQEIARRGDSLTKAIRSFFRSFTGRFDGNLSIEDYLKQKGSAGLNEKMFKSLQEKHEREVEADQKEETEYIQRNNLIIESGPDVFSPGNTLLLNEITAAAKKSGIVQYRGAFDPQAVTEDTPLTFTRIV